MGGGMMRLIIFFRPSTSMGGEMSHRSMSTPAFSADDDDDDGYVVASGAGERRQRRRSQRASQHLPSIQVDLIVD